jgi:cell division protein ZapE
MLQQYQQQVSARQIQFDPAQWFCLQQLAELATTFDVNTFDVKTFDVNTFGNPAATETAISSPPRGIYLYGPVGRGKTMLMDLFYQHLPTDAKIRLHFHHFMARVHQELHLLNGQPEPLRHIAKQWAQQYRVLCFDEFFVSDIGDAMLLGTLWRELFALGVVLVITSNAPPDQLYLNGLQRSRFLPTIALLQQYCQVLPLDHGLDYRRLSAADFRYYQLVSAAHSDWLQQQVEQLTGPLQPITELTLLQRPMVCLWRNQTAIGFDFMALCSGPRSQLDYMALASDYRLIAVANIPQFTRVSDTAILHGVEENYQREAQDLFVSKLDNEARRFIALVDECYDRGCLLLLTAQVPVTALYQASQLSFAFERTVSRLYEMQSWRLDDLESCQNA